jgi:hypothetical protein
MATLTRRGGEILQSAEDWAEFTGSRVQVDAPRRDSGLRHGTELGRLRGLCQVHATPCVDGADPIGTIRAGT